MTNSRNKLKTKSEIKVFYTKTMVWFTFCWMGKTNDQQIQTEYENSL